MATARKTTKKAVKAPKASAARSKKATRTVKRSKPVARKRTPSPNGKTGSKPPARTNGKSPETRQPAPLTSQKEMLEQERAQVEMDLAKFRAELQDAPDMTGDEVDLNVYEREKTLGLVSAYERRLEEIDATLKIAAQGKYGICERCGNPIAPERLEIFPETRLCISCKNIVEREQRRLRM